MAMYGRRFSRPVYRRRFRPFRRAAWGAASAYRKTTKVTKPGPSGSGPLRSQVRQLRTYVRKLAPEQKSIDLDLDVTNLASSGAIVSIVNIPSGAGDDDRIGNTINITGIIVNGIIVRSTDFTNGAANNSYIRFCVVQDTQQVADTAPTAASMFLDPAEPWNLVAPAQSSRFRVLWASQLFDLARIIPDSDLIPLSAIIPTMSPVFSFQWSGNVKVDYNGSAGTDVEKNGLYFVALTNNTVSTGDIEAKARVIYTDV